MACRSATARRGRPALSAARRAGTASSAASRASTASRARAAGTRSWRRTRPTLRGDTVHFVALEDGTLVVEEDEPDDALTPLADAIETRLAAPYRAEAVRRDGALWGVAGRRITVVSEPGLSARRRSSS